MRVKFHALKDHVKVIGEGATVEVDADFVDPFSVELNDKAYSMNSLEKMMNEMDKKDVKRVIQSIFSPSDLVECEIDTDYNWV